jgi:hypothetical protein
MARKSLQRINGNVEGYDLEHEFAVIMQEIEEGKKLSDSTKSVNILSTLRGTNLVSRAFSNDEIADSHQSSDEPTSPPCPSLGSDGEVLLSSTATPPTTSRLRAWRTPSLVL